MKVNGIIKPDICYTVPEHTSFFDEKIAYFFSEDEAREFANIVEGNLTVFSAKVLVEGEYYSASVRYQVDG